MLASSTEESEVRDPWVTRMRSLPATVVSTRLKGPLDWPDATIVSGDAVDIVARLKQESDVPLRSHGSLSMNRALLAAGLVDRLQVTLFPVITGQTGDDPIFQGAADFDLELLENRTLDGHIQELIYRPRSIDLPIPDARVELPLRLRRIGIPDDIIRGWTHAERSISGFLSSSSKLWRAAPGSRTAT